MSNHIAHLLSQWHPDRNKHDWVLGTVYQTCGPAYRKAGAMMLFNSVGQCFGLLSGGCLEAELHRQASRVMFSQRTLTLRYDGSDEDDFSFQLGIGCGGTVDILLQPVNAANDYLGLCALHQRLEQNQSSLLWQRIPDHHADSETHSADARVEPVQGADLPTKAQLTSHQGSSWLLTPVKPLTTLLVVGGGVDARPLVAMAGQLGWSVTVCDPRPANGRQVYFPAANTRLSCRPQALADPANRQNWDAAVVMSHNLTLDAEAINALQAIESLAYLALLGPAARKQEVLTLAGLQEQTLRTPLHGPAGLDLGAELPEGIALSILSHCYGVLHGGDGAVLGAPAGSVRMAATE